ncbi:MAG: MgtC/SapB family protein [Pseudomonadota bacterium]
MNLDWSHLALSLATALACGLLIGIERGWKLKDEEPGTRVAGIRTFSMLGLGAGAAGLAGRLGYPLVAGVIAFALVALMALAYAPELKEHRDATSAVAAIATVAMSFLAGIGQPALAIASAAVAVTLLAMRTELHRFVDRLGEEDVKALARYAIIAGAILPFLPSGHYGPFGAWNPQKLWLVVVLVTGFSFLGYIANRLFGERNGTIATAVIGGLYSSTAVTQSLAQRLGKMPKGGEAESAGIALATSIMYLRIVALVGILSTRVLPAFAALMAPAFIVSTLASWWLFRRASKRGEPTMSSNPIAILPALGFLAFVAFAAVAAKWAETRFGEEGIAVLLLIVGSTDVDTAIITLGGLDPAAIGAGLAAVALTGTVVANMAVKLGITLVYARSNGKTAAIALGASIFALLCSIAVAWVQLH